MTILQLRYVITIANSGSFREAANRLFVSQPALSSTVRELEEELGIKIFERNNKGITISDEGSEFLVYAKEALSQYEIIEDRFLKKDNEKARFSVSLQHYVFAVQAFSDVVKQYDEHKYVFSVKETKTDEVLSDVKNLRSEIGVISYSSSNKKVMEKILREYHLKFYPLMTRDTYVYVWKDHPLAGEEELSLEDLCSYPCITFDQSSDSDFYLSEEALGDHDFDKIIKSTDRASTAELMSSLRGFSIGIGNLKDSAALSEGIVTIKLKEQDPLTIGYIVRDNHELSDIGKSYIKALSSFGDS